MNTNLKFDHTQEELSDAIGFNGDINDALQKSTEALVAEFEDGQPLSTSVILEGVLKHFSDEEIVILAAIAVKDAIIGRMSASEQMMQMMSELGMSEDDLINTDDFLPAAEE